MSNNRIGHYYLYRTIGRGEFSKVKRAVHIPTNSKVAIKVIEKKEIERKRMQSAVDREIKITTSLFHPHIVKWYEVISTSNYLFFVMEYPSSQDLFEYILSNGRLTENESLKIFQQIICALDYCHYNGVIHRDLKPENILLDNDKNIRIADFGLSNTMKDGYFLKTDCGSYNYAAPEILSEKLYNGTEIDIWSSGIILYVLLCAKLPFDAPNLPNLMKKIKSGIFEIPTYLSEGPAKLICRMLTVNPLERITIDEIKENEWFNKIKLPKYLQKTPKQYNDEHGLYSKILNKKVVNLLKSQQNIKENEIKQALNYGNKLLIKVINKYTDKKLPKLRYIAVCYGLLYEKEYRLNILKDIENNKKNKNKSNNNNNDLLTLQTQKKLRDKLSSSMHYHLTDDYQFYLNNNIQWAVGIKTILNSSQIIQNILLFLKENNMEWLFNPNSRCCITARDIKMDKKVDNGESLQIKIQLYLSNFKSSSNYILDIQRLNGYTFCFLDFCAKIMHLIKRLQIT